MWKLHASSAFLIVLFLGFLFTGLWQIQYYDEYKNCIHDHQTQQYQATHKDAPSSVFTCESFVIDKHAGAVTVVATLVVAFFTIVLGIATIYLWVAGERQLTHAKESSERQLRAYVGTDKRSSSDFHHSFGPLQAYVEIKNFGQTPAYRMECMCAVIVKEVPFENVPFEFDMTDAGKFTLHPGESTFLTAIRPTDEPREMSEDELKAIWGGTKAVFVFGKVIYEDVFGEKRVTAFAYKKGDGTPIEGTTLAMCQFGNASN